MVLICFKNDNLLETADPCYTTILTFLELQDYPQQAPRALSALSLSLLVWSHETNFRSLGCSFSHFQCWKNITNDIAHIAHRTPVFFCASGRQGPVSLLGPWGFSTGRGWRARSRKRRCSWWCERSTRRNRCPLEWHRYCCCHGAGWKITQPITHRIHGAGMLT